MMMMIRKLNKGLIIPFPFSSFYQFLIDGCTHLRIFQLTFLQTETKYNSSYKYFNTNRKAVGLAVYRNLVEYITDHMDGNF